QGQQQPQQQQQPRPQQPPAGPRPAPVTATAAPSRAAVTPTTPAPSPAGGRDGNGHGDWSDIRATPAVRKLASENDVDISQIEGTGLGGRVSRKDVEDFIASRQAEARSPQQPAAERPTPQQQQVASRVVPAQPQGQAPRPAPVPSLAGDTLVPLTQMRRAIANNMVQAWSAPHAHAVMPVDVT